jgi:hypothetical protein
VHSEEWSSLFSFNLYFDDHSSLVIFRTVEDGLRLLVQVRVQRKIRRLRGRVRFWGKGPVERWNVRKIWKLMERHSI